MTTQRPTGTFGSEDALPRVPLPSLDATCARFLEWCAPLLDDSERSETESAVAEALQADSPMRALQTALETYAVRSDGHSWLDAFWETRYLGRRDRIALNANFFFLFDHDGAGQVDRAATLVSRAVAYKLLIDEEALPVARRGGAPLSMEQCRYLFSTTRIPGAVQDTARTPYSSQWPGPSRARHVVVLRGGRMFSMDVVGAEGRPHTQDELVDGLTRVLADDRPGDEEAVGHLTTTARAEWARGRQALLDHHPTNARMVETVETALFCLCLDDVTPEDARTAGEQLLYGGNGNRWFDKALSLVVFADGTAGLNGEHCRLDGTTIVNLVDALVAGLPDVPRAGAPPPPQGPPEVHPLEFVLSDDLRADARRAGSEFAAYAAGTTAMAVTVTGVGTDTIKALAMSPDAFAQMAFQLAHRRSRGLVGTTYESVSMRHYRHGRTEAMRVVTPEVVAFVAAMDDPDIDVGTRVAAFRSAAERHVVRARECQAGQAPEQHLWELQLVQQRRGAELGVPGTPALYASPGWRILREDFLSTSAVPSEHVQYFGFGSTSATCIGVGYAVLADRLNIFSTTTRSVAPQMQAFVEALQAAVHELRDLLAADGTSGTDVSR